MSAGEDDDVFVQLQAPTVSATKSPLRTALGKQLSAVFDSAVGQCSQPSLVEPIKVFLRLRPLIAGEESAINVLLDGRTVKATAPDPLNQRKEYRDPRHYSFTRVMDETTTQEAMYTAAAEDIVHKFRTEGKSGLIFTYGVTNAGKSHTVVGSKENPGLLPRAVASICEGLDFTREVCFNSHYTCLF
jgi:kinesin family protein 20